MFAIRAVIAIADDLDWATMKQRLMGERRTSE
jgi:hypothetical protein